ncbi:hypothetical protein AALO_G00171870 [Alosa alosa]|uniref:Uncharacterized protein n=1 Tax=Alosa alosa TaxID=278164 RepID=A0AAV6GGC0_9TELE|nr:hypothetical protein AALO_G00171870 [Alosa alosa]
MGRLRADSPGRDGGSCGGALFLDDKKKKDSGALLKFLSPPALPKDTSTDEGTPSTSSSIHEEEADIGFYGTVVFLQMFKTNAQHMGR